MTPVWPPLVSSPMGYPIFHARQSMLSPFLLLLKRERANGKVYKVEGMRSASQRFNIQHFIKIQ